MAAGRGMDADDGDFLDSPPTTRLLVFEYHSCNCSSQKICILKVFKQPVQNVVEQSKRSHGRDW